MAAPAAPQCSRRPKTRTGCRAGRTADGRGSQRAAVGENMHKRLVALPSGQAAEHRRGSGREMVTAQRD